MVIDLLILTYRFKTTAGEARIFASNNFRFDPFECEISSVKNGPSTANGPFSLVLFLTGFLAAALASQRFLYSLPLAGLQVKRVTLYFLNNVLGLHLPLEPPQRVFEGFTLLKSNFGQRTTPPHSS
jgi:hypothetical protein